MNDECKILLELTKNGNAWRIDKFKFNLKYVDGNANLEASQQIL